MTVLGFAAILPAATWGTGLGLGILGGTVIKRLLLLSNSTTSQGGFLGHAIEAISDFLGSDVTEVLFIPYAAVIESYDTFTSKTYEPFARSGYRLTSIHTCHDLRAAVGKAQAIVIGGGNSFQLLHCLYDMQIMQAIRDRINSDMPYIGWSAGANIAYPTIKTTNDMPVVWPPSPNALNLIPFQINPHYVDANPPGFYGETREQRLAEFTHLNPDIPVVGLPEGGMIRIEEGTIQLLGSETATAFRNGAKPTAYRSLHMLEKLLY